MALNLEKQLVFYGAYHHNPVNVGIHIACVPMILGTYLMLGTNSPDLPLPSWLSIPHFPINFGTVNAIVFATTYILMEPVAGGMITPLLLGWTAVADHLTSTYGATANYWAAAVFVVSWLLQFIGHGKFEGRAPALLDSLIQALVLAPFFVWFEVLFYLGYRPGLKSRLDKAVEREIQKFKTSKNEGNGTAKGKKAE